MIAVLLDGHGSIQAQRTGDSDEATARLLVLTIGGYALDPVRHQQPRGLQVPQLQHLHVSPLLRSASMTILPCMTSKTDTPILQRLR